MLAKLSALWRVFRQGEEVANAKTWKDRTIAINAVVALLAALLAAAKAFGLQVDISADDLNALAAGVVVLVGLVNGVVHVATSAKVGLRPRDPPAAEGPGRTPPDPPGGA